MHSKHVISGNATARENRIHIPPESGAYIEYVEVCRNFIRAARASNWTLHLYSAGKIINLFTATRHHSYAKSACVYVKIMFALPEKHPWLHQKFDDEGLCVARRAHFWTVL